MSYFGLITGHKFVIIHMNTPNIVYYKFSQMNIEHEYSTVLILQGSSSPYVLKTIV